MRRLAILAVAMVVYATPAAASADNWWFKTPGEAAYCGVGEVGGFVCMTPNDGFWIRFTDIFSDNDVDVRKGYSDRFRGYRDRAVQVLGFGRVQYSSDAAVITCWSRRTGLTCKHYEGLSFWLGRYRGYRIFYDAPGFPPNVRPLFRTGHRVRCGIDRDNLEPASPVLQCWRPADGLALGIARDDAGRRGGHGRSEKALGFRPPGFRLLAYGRTLCGAAARSLPSSLRGARRARAHPSSPAPAVVHG